MREDGGDPPVALPRYQRVERAGGLAQPANTSRRLAGDQPARPLQRPPFTHLVCHVLCLLLRCLPHCLLLPLQGLDLLLTLRQLACSRKKD